MELSPLPLNDCQIKKPSLIVNRFHLLHGFALLCLFYYRITTFAGILRTRETPLAPYVLISLSEFMFAFLWVLEQAANWRPVSRTVYPDRLPEDGGLPRVDVFICTADPNKEPSVEVMNTVISALALDYPPEKLAVYLSDDGGSPVTVGAIRQAWSFGKRWVPFCRKYAVKTRCPEAYFSSAEEKFEGKYGMNSGFVVERKEMEERYNEMKNELKKILANPKRSASRDHPSMVEVLNDGTEDMPFLVYVAREKRPSQPHHFKAGALNVLLKVSAVISNAPYFLVLDCDMFCNNATSARQAMCFYLDSKISSSIAYVQFPQDFHNKSEHDLYDGRLRHYWVRWEGSDGVRGPLISGCNFYMRREAIYDSKKASKDFDLTQLKKSFGSSNEFIKSLNKTYKPNMSRDGKVPSELRKEIDLLASCSYDNSTEWGKEVGFRYYSVVEDYFTGFLLHCKGWISVYMEPQRPCFLGSCPINLGDMLFQQTRWAVGLLQIGLSSKFSPLLYGSLRMSILESMIYAAIAMDPLYVFPFYGLALVPQICLFHGVSLYPKVSDPFFLVFPFLFFSSQLKQMIELILEGDSIRTWLYESRVWMMKSATCYLFGTLDAILDKLGLNEANFTLTNKVVDQDQSERHQRGIYDFQVPTLLIAPMCTLYILNMASFIIGVARNYTGQDGTGMLIQTLIPLFGIVMNYHLLEGMMLRRDRGRISPYVSLLSVPLSAVLLCLGSVMVVY